MDGLYVIFDRAADEYGPVYQAQTDEVAKRQFLNLLKNVSKWDRDSFELWILANINNGEIILTEKRKIDIVFPKFFDSVTKDMFEGSQNG